MPASEWIAQARSFSRYLDRCLSADTALAAELEADAQRPFGAAEMAAWLGAQAIAGEADLRRVLRQLRQRVMARLIVRDLAGLADLAEVTGTMTALADLAITRATDFFEADLAATFGRPVGADSGAVQSLVVIAMGKLGGGELNVSSDIDLIFAYAEDGETTGPRHIANVEYFTRLARRLIPALSEPTADGFVFRVDMRLRPYGDSGAIVSNFAAMENYYQTQGREWERYAFIKARVVRGGDGDALMCMLTPFVYRKYLDFGAIASMRALHEQICQEVRRHDRVANIKTGPGGIREIEFAAQVFQLIRGGREPRLRVRPTLQVLDVVGTLGLMPPATVTELAAAYVFLRRLEHRIQYVEDAQTHDLPTDAGTQEQLARAMDFETADAFHTALDAHRRRVAGHFRQLFAAQESDAPAHPLAFLWLTEPEAEHAQAVLTDKGYARPAEALQRLSTLRNSSRYQSLAASSRGRMDRLMPQVIAVAAEYPDADQALLRLLDLVETICGREAYMAMLEEYPVVLNRVARVCAASPWAAHYMGHHPLVLDQLLTARSQPGLPDWPVLETELAQALEDAGGDVETCMDRLRQFKNARIFDLLVLDLAGGLSIEQLADHLSALADLILRRTLALCWRQTGRSGEPRFAIIAYGKLGGKELGYASDLDLIFLYDEDQADAAERYARLAQRINAWLSSYTSAGLLYETDLRLRPNGAAGLLVSSLAAFERYQTHEAWVWEHQALTRARFVAGDAAIGAAFDRIRNTVLQQPRDPDKLAHEIIAMRGRMLDAHPNDSGQFDVKHDRGGMVDIEFIVQHLVLGHAAAHPQLTENVGNLRLLEQAGELGLIATEAAAAAQAAYRQYRLWQHQQRLQEARYARVPRDMAAGHAQQVLALWRDVFGSDGTPGGEALHLR